MSDYIKREDAIRATYGFERYTGIDEAPVEFAYNILRAIPSADVVERKMMKLIKVNPNNTAYYSDEFIKGFECGAKRQFEADMRADGKE